MLTSVTGINWGDEEREESWIFSQKRRTMLSVIREAIMPGIR